MGTNRLYYSDCYLSNFEAKVIDSAENGQRIYLDRTAFYPTSGGQPHDLGTLAGKVVVDVVDEGARIAHLLAEPVQEDAVQGEIDWPRRYDDMQQHTGQHLLSAAFVELFGAQTLSFHMGAEISSVELAMKDLNENQINEIETRVNEVVWQARPVTISFEEADSVDSLRKASARTGTLRIVEIAGFDRSACGGTHVRSTAELGPIQILRSERMRGNVRVEFVCGGRALKRAKEEHRTLTELSRIASSTFDDLSGYVAGLRDRLAETEKAHQRLTAELARSDGEDVYRKTAASSDGIHRWLMEAPSIDDAARAKVQSFCKLPKAVALVIGAKPPGVLIACSPDSGINAGVALKAALSRVGGRGGGSATLAQGALPDTSILENLKLELGF